VLAGGREAIVIVWAGRALIVWAVMH
jgi:hypothetical protein